MEEYTNDLIIEVAELMVQVLRDSIGDVSGYFMEEDEPLVASLKVAIYASLVNSTINAINYSIDETKPTGIPEELDVDWDTVIKDLLKGEE